MIDQVRQLIDVYYSWLRDKTSLKELEDWVEITTPYLDRHNDYVQLYAKLDSHSILLSDDGYTIRDLEESGCHLDSEKRQLLLTMTLNGFGVDRDGDALVTKASESSFSLKKHNLVQAMLAVNDLFFIARPFVKSLFLEDVTTWMEQKEIRSTPRVKFSGKTGFDYVFDFVIPSSRVQPERIIKAINRPDKSAASSLIMAWEDTRNTRPDNSRAYAFLNDQESSIDTSVIEALNNYDVRPVLWRERDMIQEELAA